VAEAGDLYTDGSGVYTADPNIGQTAKLLSEISYDEMLEMARVGAQVLHPRAVALARKYGLPVRVRNTVDTEHHGTILRGAGEMELFKRVSGMTLDRHQARCAILQGPIKPAL